METFMSLEIKGYRSVKKGSLDGYLDVFIPNLNWTICGCGLFINGDKKWVNMPARSVKNEEGKITYQDIIAMPKDLKNKFSSAALEAYKKYEPPKEPEAEPDFFNAF
jgi:DNA-binding cell septation regulator SpoVG